MELWYEYDLDDLVVKLALLQQTIADFKGHLHAPAAAGSQSGEVAGSKDGLIGRREQRQRDSACHERAQAHGVCKDVMAGSVLNRELMSCKSSWPWLEQLIAANSQRS